MKRCKKYKDGDLKNVDICEENHKLQCYKLYYKLQRSWVSRFYGDSFQDWKIILLRFIKNTLGHCFRFHSNLAFKRHYVKSFPHYYRVILFNWKRNLSQKLEVPYWILSQNLLCNQNIQIDKEPVHLVNFLIKTLKLFYNFAFRIICL